MSIGATDIREAVKKLAGTDEREEYSYACTVSDIDTTAMTCTATPINGDPEIFNVLLNADAKKGFTLIPENGSIVIVTMQSNATGFVSMVSNVSQIYLHGEDLGGLVKINDLKTQYDSFVTGIKAACVAGFTALSGLDSGASLSAFNAAAASILSLNLSTLENTKVKHGS